MTSITSISTLSPGKKRERRKEKKREKERHPLDPPSYVLKDLPKTKANSILYLELENRQAEMLHQPDIKALLERSKKRLQWAKVGGGGRCEQRLIDDLDKRISFLEKCVCAKQALTEGKYNSSELRGMHGDLVALEKSIGGYWARPRKTGKEWRYLSQDVVDALKIIDSEILDGLEEFMVVSDLLHAIISSTGLSNLLLFGDAFPKERRGYLEDRLMGEYILVQNLHEYDELYDGNGGSHPRHKNDKLWRFDHRNLQDRLAVIGDFVGSSLKNLAREGKEDVELASWSDEVFEVDMSQEATPLNFEEKYHLAEHAIALKARLRALIYSNAVLKPEDTEIYQHEAVGPSGPNIEFCSWRRKDKAFLFPEFVDLGRQDANKFTDRWEVGPGSYGHRYAEEINHRGCEFNVLREEFKHAIRYWFWLWTKHMDAITEHLMGSVGFESVGEESENEEMVVEEAVVDEAFTTPDKTTLDIYDAKFTGSSFSENSAKLGSSNQGRVDMHFANTSSTTAEVIHDSGHIEKFSSKGDTLTTSSSFNEGLVVNDSSTPKSFTSFQDTIVEEDSWRHQPEELEAPKAKRQKTLYLQKLNIHKSHLDSESRVCPETGETWWADMPPYFLYGETPTMAQVVSDRMKEDLRKGEFMICERDVICSNVE